MGKKLDSPELVFSTMFDQCVEFDLNGGCWLWSSTMYDTGYGAIHSNYKTYLAHRVSWKVFHGTDPGELCVCHKCDVRACVNPAHFFLGTKGDNARDKARKGRCHNNKGERHGMAVLTDEDAREILRLRNRGLIQKDIAKMFGISRGTVSDITRGRRWTHISRKIQGDQHGL